MFVFVCFGGMLLLFGRDVVFVSLVDVVLMLVLFVGLVGFGFGYDGVVLFGLDVVVLFIDCMCYVELFYFFDVFK